MSLVKHYLYNLQRERDIKGDMQPLSKEAYQAILKEWHDSLSKPLQ